MECPCSQLSKHIRSVPRQNKGVGRTVMGHKDTGHLKQHGKPSPFDDMCIIFVLTGSVLRYTRQFCNMQHTRDTVRQLVPNTKAGLFSPYFTSASWIIVIRMLCRMWQRAICREMSADQLLLVQGKLLRTSTKKASVTVLSGKQVVLIFPVDVGR